ncbi:hypothetical protein OIU77_000784 [Salix suchowensis]|uniref:Uncharacterized protein n=1 Tax=Salix suchowensis TaxID=1278906 RepID=A0ABQ9B905_9ROSI|nr:hypothetical protein OIU77_000784 [Salix suchowensis]
MLQTHNSKRRFNISKIKITVENKNPKTSSLSISLLCASSQKMDVNRSEPVSQG